MITRLTPLGKFVVVLCLLLAAAFAGAAGATATKPHAQAWRCVLVRPGDTLWSLSRHVAPRDDPRAVSERIARRNGLRGSALSAGAALWVPFDDGADLPAGAECGPAR